jgi:hypothetical protein
MIRIIYKSHSLECIQAFGNLVNRDMDVFRKIIDTIASIFEKKSVFYPFPIRSFE